MGRPGAQGLSKHEASAVWREKLSAVLVAPHHGILGGSFSFHPTWILKSVQDSWPQIQTRRNEEEDGQIHLLTCHGSVTNLQSTRALSSRWTRDRPHCSLTEQKLAPHILCSALKADLSSRGSSKRERTKIPKDPLPARGLG